MDYTTTQTTESSQYVCLKRTGPRRCARVLKAALLTSCSLILVAGEAKAADTGWIGGGGDWFTSSNWDIGVPTAGDNAILGFGSNAQINGAGAAAATLTVSGDPGGLNPTLNIATNSASLTTDTTNVGVAAGDFGTINVDTFSSWTNTQILTLGDSGTGTLNVDTSGVVSTGGTLAAVNAGSSATINVSNDGYLQLGTIAFGVSVLGDAGTATMSISSGADAVAYALYAGQSSGGSGTITVDGAGSTLSIQSDLIVGSNGTGALTLSNGGEATVGSDFMVGSDPQGNGSVLIQGSSASLNIAGGRVGGFGQGTLTILDGAAMTSSGSVQIGRGIGSSGTVNVTGSGSDWSALGIEVGRDGTGTLTIADGGEVAIAAGAGTLDLAVNVDSTGTLNIGAAAADAAAAAGSLNAASVQFGNGTGTINFNHTTGSGAAAPLGGHDFSASISGSGTINHLAGVTTFSGVSTGFTGTTNITGGRLYVNDTLSGEINVAGGLLGGGGYLLGNVTVGSGGTFAPGNSIGSLSLNSSITFNTGSVYEVELNNGGFVAGTNNDFIGAGGTATINGGTVHVTPVFGGDDGSTYTPGSYTIITAAGGVTGTFDGLTDDFAFLSFVLSYDLNNVYLTSALNPITSFCLAGMTSNQCATGDGVFSLGAGGLFTALLGLSDAAAPGVLDQLSGELHASLKTALLEDSRFVREAALDRLRNALNGVGASAAQVEQESPEGATLWGQGFGSWSHWNSDGNAASLDRSIGGFFLGADAQFANDVYLGLMGGYSRSWLDIDDRASSATVDSYTLGAYAGGAWEAFSLKSGVAHSWHDVDTARSVFFSGISSSPTSGSPNSFSDSLSASYSARTFQVFGEAAYSVTYRQARFEPFANLAYVNLATDGFTESGDAAALTAGSSSTNATFTSIGLRAETRVVLGGMDARLSGGLGWRHAFGDVPTSTHAFAAGGNDFTVAGVPLAKDLFALDAGITMNATDRATLGIAYDGQFGSGLSDHGAKATFSVKF